MKVFLNGFLISIVVSLIIVMMFNRENSYFTSTSGSAQSSKFMMVNQQTGEISFLDKSVNKMNDEQNRILSEIANLWAHVNQKALSTRAEAISKRVVAAQKRADDAHKRADSAHSEIAKIWRDKISNGQEFYIRMNTLGDNRRINGFKQQGKRDDESDTGTGYEKLDAWFGGQGSFMTIHMQ